ncbi:MAG: phospho-sugar mutase [Lachnospiraceae bacterium]|uniref:phosphoglucomutase (alpha-D-glucose-1,6-bisphosphate-dependent) n=1 Tax=Candidatus Weimeria bifida TaxID=2599074 RepID=A0A6N7J0Y7_9FIRM|nr:phospho-sugar mutase [Candidatus Weimeria bifida]RRF97359.1 MAG: phospho-sugar mutase [Lachnospiraceae bacterium]
MGYKEKYNEWLEKLPEGSALRDELLSVTDEGEIEERFYKDLSFGTAGLRGKVGAGSNMMNVITVGKATQGIADFIVSQGEDAMKAGVVIAHDPRHFSKEFSELAAGIFAANGIKVYTFPDLRPTPELAFMIRKLHTVSGINITASHNPKEYNGYKAYWEDGCQVSSDIADAMTDYINKTDQWNGVKTADYDEMVKAGKITVLGPEYDRMYLDRIEALAIHSGDELDLSIPLVYTPLNGCGSIPFRQMLTDRGFTNWTIVPEQQDPDPDFTTVGYPNPEDPKAFKLSEKYGREKGAELLMATDPDSDRFAIEIRNSDGDYVPLNGNQTGYLLVNYILEGHKTAGTLPEKGAMVKSIVTSTLSTRMAKAYGVDMFETLTGFKNICGKIPYLHEHGYTYLFGYEESVGYAACEDIRDKDGISAGMLVAEAAAYYRKQGKTLWDVLNDIYAKYGCFAEDEPNIILEGIEGSERIGRMMKWVRENEPEKIAGNKVEKIIDYIDGYEDIPPQNCLKFFLAGDSWFAIRPSGTEPKIKFYFYSCRNSLDEAHKANDAIKNEVIETIKKVQ